MSDRPSDEWELDELRDEFDWMFEFNSRMAERIREDPDVHNLASYVSKLERENERLREMVKKAQAVIEGNCALCDYFTGCTILQDGRCAAQTLFRQELRELGVDDG